MPTTSSFSQTVTTANTTTTTAAVVNPLPPVPLINLILADVNAVLPNFSSLVSSYRLLVGAAEEIHRTPDICPDVFERAVRRYDNTGLLLDVLLELLCCKIVFSSNLLHVTCGPVDLVRYLLTCLDGDDSPCRSAQTVAGLAALKRLQDNFCDDKYCLPVFPVVCPRPPAPLTATVKPPETAKPSLSDSDISDIIETKLISILNQSGLLTLNLVPAAAASAANEKDLETEIITDVESPVDIELETEVDLRYTSKLRPKYLPGSDKKKRRSPHQLLRSPSTGQNPNS